jgi:2-oxoisovalerate dehydrogenase E1 component
MKTALRAGDPVIMLETKALFASRGPVPEGEHLVPFGLARIARPGSDLTIASAGQLVHRALEAARMLAQDGIECEVIDLRTIQPLDVDTVVDSVRRTHRLLIVDEGWSAFGLGAELGQSVQELAFDELDAPIARLHTEPVTHPFGPPLERAMLVDTDRILAAARAVIGGTAPPPRRWSGRAEGTPAPIDVAAASPVAPAPAAPAEATDGEPITMPFGDLTVSEGKLVRWLQDDGAAIEAGAIVAEIETDKAVVEIEAPASGRLAQHVRAPGTTIRMGETIGAVRRA